MTDHFLKIMIMLITSVFINMFLYFDLTTPVAPPPPPPNDQDYDLYVANGTA